jgi:hypothetical protein
MTRGQRDRQPSGSYEIRIRGHLGKTMLRAFPALHADTRDGATLLRGVDDQAALHGVLAQIETLGLELLEVRRLPREPTTGPSSWTPDAGPPGEASSPACSTPPGRESQLTVTPPGTP